MFNENSSPFSFFNKNIKSNNLCFNNKYPKKLNETTDFFSIEDNKQANLQFRTKQRMGFYNNGNSSQVKQYLDYFLKNPKPNNINDINFTSCTGTGEQIKHNFIPKEEINFKNSSLNGSINNNSINVIDSNNGKLNNENDVNSEEKDCCCPAPCCKLVNNSINNSYSNSNEKNSFSNIIFNNNYGKKLTEDNFDLLANEISQMSFNEKKIKKTNINKNNKILVDEKKLKKMNPNIIEKISWLEIKY